MGYRSLLNYTSLGLCVASILLWARCYRPLPTLSLRGPIQPRTYWFAFGDSYSATGFDINSTQPSPSNPMGNNSPDPGTQSGGYNWIEYLTREYNNSLILSYDLAIAGATIDNSIATWGYGDMTSQVAAFQARYASKPAFVRWFAADTLVSFWVGINDVYYGFAHNNESSTFVTTLLDKYRPLVEQLYSVGVRKFLFVNCPPTTRSPQVHEENDLPEQFQRHAAMVTAFNDGLGDMVSRFSNDHTDATVVLYDSWSFMTHVLDNFKDYGYQDPTCMNTDGSSCVWWNNLHPGWLYHKHQAEDMLRSLAPLGW